MSDSRLGLSHLDCDRLCSDTMDSWLELLADVIPLDGLIDEWHSDPDNMNGVPQVIDNKIESGNPSPLPATSLTPVAPLCLAIHKRINFVPKGTINRVAPTSKILRRVLAPLSCNKMTEIKQVFERAPPKTKKTSEHAPPKTKKTSERVPPKKPSTPSKRRVSKSVTDKTLLVMVDTAVNGGCHAP